MCALCWPASSPDLLASLATHFQTYGAALCGDANCLTCCRDGRLGAAHQVRPGSSQVSEARPVYTSMQNIVKRAR